MEKRPERPPRGQPVGAVLLEVVLALTIFVGAAVVVGSGLTASVASVERLRLNTHAVNLAVSLLAELEMGRYPLQNAGPTPWETPFQEWTWEIRVESEASETDLGFVLRRVEIIIRHETKPIVHRVCQWLPAAFSSPSLPETSGLGGSALNTLDENLAPL